MTYSSLHRGIKHWGGYWLIAVVVTIVMMNIAGGLWPPARSPSRGELRDHETRAFEAKCRLDTECFATRNYMRAEALCARQIESQELHAVRWLDSMAGRKFERHSRLLEGSGVVTYLGERLQVEDGSGKYRYHTYDCTYDVDQQLVVSTNIQLGRWRQ